MKNSWLRRKIDAKYRGGKKKLEALDCLDINGAASEIP